MGLRRRAQPDDRLEGRRFSSAQLSERSAADGGVDPPRQLFHSRHRGDPARPSCRPRQVRGGSRRGVSDCRMTTVVTARLLPQYGPRSPAAPSEPAALPHPAPTYGRDALGQPAKTALAADPSVESALPEVEWPPIARMRDRVAHHYWATDRDVVWATATVAVPELRATLAAALAHLA